MCIRLLIAVIVGAGLFAALALYAQPLSPEGPLDFRLITLIGLGGALAIGAVVVIIAGHQRWWWLGGALSPFVGTVLYLRVSVAPLGGELGEDALSPLMIMLICSQYLPTAIAGALAAGYVLGQAARLRSPAGPRGSSERRVR